MALDYAYDKYWTTDNVYHRVDFSIYNDMLMSDTPVKERAHSAEEISSIIKELHRIQQIRPKSSSAWALEL